MKELTQDFKANEVRTEIVSPERRQKKLTDRLTPYRGLTIWEYELRTGVLKEAVFSTSTVEIEGDKNKRPIVHKKVDRKDDSIYFAALNRKSATKKLKKNGYFVKSENGQ